MSRRRAGGVQVEVIRSGGQSGVDRAALDSARKAGIPVTGWCPRGREAEDGPIDPAYPLQETPSSRPSQRTEWNVRDSDGTLVVLLEASDPGTELTVSLAGRFDKPLLLARLSTPPDIATLRHWLAVSRVRDLNVAGPRESHSPGIYASTRQFLDDLLSHLF